MIRAALSASVIQRGRSGVATYVFGLLEGLRRIGAPVEMTVLGLADDRPLFEPWLPWAKWVAVPERYRPALRNIGWHQSTLRGLLREERTEVLHIPSYRRIVAHPPCPQVVTIHDCAAFAVKKKYDAARMLYGCYVVRLLARQADVVSTVSRATALDVEQYFGLPLRDLAVIWNGIDHEHFRPPAPLHRLHEAPYFIYLARLEHPGKNHLRLIEAFELFCAQHPELRHDLLLGGADWHGAEVIHARVAASPQRARIRTLGFVRREDLPHWYGGATAMVYPSLFEGFGLPPIEAMACGCPVICSAAGSLGEVVGDAARIIDPAAPADISRALGELATNEAQAADWRRRGLARAAEFSWDKTAAGVFALYEKAVARPVAGGVR